MNLADSQMDFAEQEKVWSQWSWILPNSPLENKARKRAFLYSLKYYSKTRIDKNRRRAPSGEGKATQQKRHLLQGALKNGGPEGTRTPDLLRVKQALYQLSYRSENWNILN